MLEKVCSNTWRLCYPILPLWIYIVSSIIVIIIFTVIGWIIFKDRRDNNGSNNKDR